MEDKKLGVINVTIRRWWCEHAITILMISWYTDTHTYIHTDTASVKATRYNNKQDQFVVLWWWWWMAPKWLMHAAVNSDHQWWWWCGPQQLSTTSIIILILHYRISTNRFCSIPSGALSQRYTYNVYATQHFGSYHRHSNNGIIMTW